MCSGPSSSFFFIGSGTRWRWARPRSVSSSPIWRSSETLRLRRRIRRERDSLPLQSRARSAPGTCRGCLAGQEAPSTAGCLHARGGPGGASSHAGRQGRHGEPPLWVGVALDGVLAVALKDIDFGQNHIVVRDGKGQKDRVTVLPGSLVNALRKAGRAGGWAGNRDATSS